MRMQRLTNTLGLLWSNSIQLTQKIVQIPRFILGCVLWTAIGLGLVECSSNYVEHTQSNLAYEWLQSEGFKASDICEPLRGLFVLGTDGVRETWYKDATFLFPSATSYTSQVQVLPLAPDQNALYADSKMYAEPKLYVESKVYTEPEVHVDSKPLHSTAEVKSEPERKSLSLRERFAFFDEPPLFIHELQSAKTSFSHTSTTSAMADSANMQSTYAEKHSPPQSFNHANPESVSLPLLRDKQGIGNHKQKTRRDNQVFENVTHVTRNDNQIEASAKQVANLNNQVASVKPALNYSPQQSLYILNQVKSQLCQKGICEQDYAKAPDVYARLLGQALVQWYQSRKM